MTRQHSIRFAVYGLGILLIIFVLSLSIGRQALYAPNMAEQQARANVPVSVRLQEMRTWPPLPDHPLYLLRMVRDRLMLLAATPADKIALQLQYADERLQSAEALIERQRYTLALTTITKAAKYSIQAAHDADRLFPNQSAPIRGEVKEKLRTQTSTIERMKPYFSDEQRSILDRLLSEMDVLVVRFP